MSDARLMGVRAWSTRAQRVRIADLSRVGIAALPEITLDLSGL